MRSWDYVMIGNESPQLMSQMRKPEFLLGEVGDQQDDNVYAFRVKFNEMFKKYKAARSCFWTEVEADYQVDIMHWDNKLSEGDRRFLSYVLAFFATADGIVNKNLDINFAEEVKPTEAKMFYHFQMAMEDIHMITYSDMLRAFIRDEAEIDRLTEAVHTFPCIKRKANWAEKYMDRKRYSFEERMIAYAIMEGVFFSSAFASIFHFKHKGLMPGLSFTNFLISRDEAFHASFACDLFMMCVNRPSEDEIHEMFREAISIEEEFIRDAIPVSLIGINADSMCTYVHYCADRLLKDLGYDPIWKASNPFQWMQSISIPQKTNRFEARTPEYEMQSETTSRVSRELMKQIDF